MVQRRFVESLLIFAPLNRTSVGRRKGRSTLSLAFEPAAPLSRPGRLQYQQANIPKADSRRSSLWMPDEGCATAIGDSMAIRIISIENDKWGRWRHEGLLAWALELCPRYLQVLVPKQSSLCIPAIGSRIAEILRCFCVWCQTLSDKR